MFVWIGEGANDVEKAEAVTVAMVKLDWTMGTKELNFKYSYFISSFYMDVIFFVCTQDYVKSDPSGRTLEDTMIIQVKQGYEPLNFTGHFQAWDRDKWSVSLPVNQL